MENIALLKEKWFKKEVERLGKEGVSKARISRELGIKPQYLNSILNGSRGLADSFLDKFIETYNINQFDLLNWGADKTIDSVTTIQFIDLLKEKDIKIEQLTNELRSIEKELAVFKAKYTIEGLDDAKDVFLKKHSSLNADNATSANVNLKEL